MQLRQQNSDLYNEQKEETITITTSQNQQSHEQDEEEAITLNPQTQQLLRNFDDEQDEQEEEEAITLNPQTQQLLRNFNPPSGKIVILGESHTSAIAMKTTDRLKKLAKDCYLILLHEELSISSSSSTNDFYRQLDHPQVGLLGFMITGIRTLDFLTKENYLSSKISERGIEKNVIFNLISLVGAFQELYFSYSNISEMKFSIQVLSNDAAAIDRDINRINTIIYTLYKMIRLFSIVKNTEATETNIHLFANMINTVRDIKNDLNSLFILFAKMLSIKLTDQYPEYQNAFKLHETSNFQQDFDHIVINTRNLFMAKNIFKAHQQFPEKMVVVLVGELHVTDEAFRNVRSIQTILKDDLGCNPANIMIRAMSDSFDIEKCLDLQLNTTLDEPKTTINTSRSPFFFEPKRVGISIPVYNKIESDLLLSNPSVPETVRQNSGRYK